MPAADSLDGSPPVAKINSPAQMRTDGAGIDHTMDGLLPADCV